MIVLLDTNALLLPHKHKVDIFSEVGRIIPEKIEIVTLSTVVEELKGIAKSASDDGAAAKVGLKLIEDKNVRIIPSSGPVDDAIVVVAKQQEAVVCTNDKDLKRRLKAKGVRIISPRGKTHLELW